MPLRRYAAFVLLPENGFLCCICLLEEGVESPLSWAESTALIERCALSLSLPLRQQLKRLLETVSSSYQQLLSPSFAVAAVAKKFLCQDGIEIPSPHFLLRSLEETAASSPFLSQRSGESRYAAIQALLQFLSSPSFIIFSQFSLNSPNNSSPFSSRSPSLPWATTQR